MVNIMHREDFKKIYGEFGYTDFQRNLYKSYYQKRKNILLSSNLERVNHEKIVKVNDFKTNLNFGRYNFDDFGDTTKSNFYTNTDRVKTYKNFIHETNERKTIYKYNNFNSFIIVNKETEKLNAINVSPKIIAYSLYEIPELEYLNKVKAICLELFHKFIMIDWIDQNAYGKRGDFMPFDWGVSWNDRIDIEMIVIEYLNSGETIPFSLWFNLQDFKEDLMNREQVLRLSGIIDKHIGEEQ